MHKEGAQISQFWIFFIIIVSFLSHNYDFLSDYFDFLNSLFWLFFNIFFLLKEMGFHSLHLAVTFVFSLLTFAMSCRQITFQFIATFVTLVPLVDCSSVLHERTDLSEVKHSHTVDLLPLS